MYGDIHFAFHRLLFGNQVLIVNHRESAFILDLYDKIIFKIQEDEVCQHYQIVFRASFSTFYHKVN